MNRFKKQFAMLFGMIALISYLSFTMFPQKEDTAPVIAISKDAEHLQVYLMDSDNILVPLSVEVDEELEEEDRIALMIAYMCGKQKITNFSPLFHKEVGLLKMEIKAGKIILDFDERFINYENENELRVLEALVWGVTQFADIEQIQICMNGKILDKMPNAGTPIPEICSRSIGINHFETASSALHSSDEITVFYTKKIGDSSYMVPKTRRIAQSDDVLAESVVQILSDVRVSSSLSQPLYEDDIKVESMIFDEGTLILELNKNILDVDKKVKQDIYNALVLSLCSIAGVDEIQLKVDGAVVSLAEAKVESVSRFDLYYNAVKF